MKIIKTQFGISSTADFEELTWTFQMPKKYEVAAGSFAIVDIISYQQINDSLSEINKISQSAGRSGDEKVAIIEALTKSLLEKL